MNETRRRLVDRKQQVIAEAARLRREITGLRRRPETRPLRRRIAELEGRLEQLAAEQHRLRIAIDRTPRSSST